MVPLKKEENLVVLETNAFSKTVTSWVLKANAKFVLPRVKHVVINLKVRLNAATDKSVLSEVGLWVPQEFVLMLLKNLL